MTHSTTPEAEATHTRALVSVWAILALWALIPEVRRLVDWRGGYADISIVSIVPLIALLLPLVALIYGGGLRRVDRWLLALSWIWLGGFTASFVVGVASGNDVAAATYSYAEFCLPAAFGLWVASLEIDPLAAFTSIGRFLLVLAAPIALYAIVQFAIPPSWDVAWMAHARITSIGQPLPFQFRPFATLNSPGIFADFLIATMLFNVWRIREMRALPLALMILCAAALMLTMVRSDWVALAVGIGCFLALSPNRRGNLTAFALTLALAGGAVAALPGLLGSTSVGATLGARLTSFTELGSDQSYAERSNYFGEPLAEAAATPQGSGLGVIGTAAKLGSTGSTKDFDNGYIARFTEMGWFGTACYLVATFGAFGYALSCRGRVPGVVVATVAAFQLALLFLDFSSDHHGAFDGLFFWLSLTLLARREPA